MSAREIPLKQWLAEIAEAEKRQPHSIYMRMRRGRIPTPPMRRINARVVLVQVGPWEDERQIKMDL